MSTTPPGGSSAYYRERSSHRPYASLERESTLNALNSSKTRQYDVSPRTQSLGSISTIGLEHGEEDYRSRQLTQNKKKSKKKRAPVSVNLTGTRYEVVKQMAENCGFIVSKEDDPNSYLFWNDSFVSTERISELKAFQKINHFPGMGEVCRKDCLARNMTKMAKSHPEEFNFVPKTWIFPSEYNSFLNYSRELKKKKKSRTFIVKPANGAMGNGIMLYRNAEKIPSNESLIVQEYIDKPFLVDGYKCDLRIYVLLTSCDPMRAFLFQDGLVRMGTEKYVHPSEGNIDRLFMHLTNYSVNKHNENYDKSGSVDTGSKRSIRFLNDYLRRHDYDVSFLWKSITDIILKTLIVSEPHVLHAYRMCRPGQAPGSDSVCFEILGFDILLDKKLRPWLLEINRSPSFGTDEKLDYDIKSGVIEDSLKLLNIRPGDKKKNLAAQKAQTQKRLLRPTRRVEGDTSELEKRRQSVERKKEELNDLLSRVRRDAAREDYENRYSGHFKRIFPPDDKMRREKYVGLLSEAFNTLMAGRAQSLQGEIQRVYNNKYREDEILDMLAQCESDERDGRSIVTNRPVKGPKPLSGMPTVSREHANDSLDLEDDDMSDAEGSSPGSPSSRKRSPGLWGQRPDSDTRPSTRSDSTHTGGQRSRSLPRAGSKLSSTSSLVSKGGLDELLMQGREKEEELTRRTLSALNDMHIKFPGKTDEEAEYILDRLHENWKFHKPRIASYWLVKLDSIKRRKVIDIVKSNVRAVLQRIWRTNDVDSLRLNRIFCRVFNRLLWSHGQGLWNCFSAQGNSWETIFSKSSEVVSQCELNCCRRIVQLCRDCLLIVYQFASDAKNPPSQSALQIEPEPPRTRLYGSHGSSPYDTSPARVQGMAWNPNQSISQRISRLYQGRVNSLS